ncbi:MAG: Cof-type HAD-IIB family hydrolase, partial [Clostridiales bacterium]|nr:Cof-type HAD-IIB family hydrolase [Clostridiales bacterium]
DFKLIALDLDGTTLNRAGHLTALTKKTLERAIRNGLQVVVASGRAMTALPAEVLAIKGLQYAITSNGSSVFSLVDERRIYGCDMSPETVLAVLAVIETACEHGGRFPFEAFIGGKAYTPQDYFNSPTAYGVPERMISYVHETRIPVSDMAGFIREHIREIEGIDLVLTLPERKDRIYQQLQGIPNLYITSSTNYYLELADVAVSKASALQVLARQLGITAEQVMAFGDGGNDLEMLQWAGHGVAMKNAAPVLLAAADDVTSGNDEDGVARYLLDSLGLCASDFV